MHPPVGPAWLVWLETSALAMAMRQWTWLYPSVEIVHILGFVVLVGAAFMFDLRLLGVSPATPAAQRLAGLEGSSIPRLGASASSRLRTHPPGENFPPPSPRE